MWYIHDNCRQWNNWHGSWRGNLFQRHKCDIALVLKREIHYSEGNVVNGDNDAKVTR